MKDMDEGSNTPTKDLPSLSPANRIERLLSFKPEDSETSEPDTEKAPKAESEKTPTPETPTEETAEAVEDETVEAEETDEDEEETETPRYTVKVDGEEVEVDLPELLKSYSYTAHNTRTAQKLAEERKAFETEAKEARELIEQYRAVLPKLEKAAEKELEDEFAGIDWKALRREDPAQFTELRAAYDVKQEQLAAVRAEREAEQAKQQEEEAKEFNAAVQREHESLMSKVPEWKDEMKRNEELAKIAEFAQKTLGFAPEDLASMYDHRAILGLRLAYKGAQVEANVEGAKRKVSEARKSAAPGKGKDKNPNPASDKFNSARERLKKSGREDDAAAALAAMFDSKV